jgi:hypothetical protein
MKFGNFSILAIALVVAGTSGMVDAKKRHQGGLRRLNPEAPVNCKLECEALDKCKSICWERNDPGSNTSNEICCARCPVNSSCVTDGVCDASVGIL